MLVVNMILVGGFALSIGAIVLLSLIGVPIPPFVVILSFAVASLFLWVYLGKSFPQSFSVLGICQSMVIGVGESPNPRSNAPRPLEVGPRRRCSFADPGSAGCPRRSPHPCLQCTKPALHLVGHPAQLSRLAHFAALAPTAVEFALGISQMTVVVRHILSLAGDAEFCGDGLGRLE